MALITCPECSRQISDKARACPGCGYPVESAKPERKTAFDKGVASHRHVESDRGQGVAPTGGTCGSTGAPSRPQRRTESDSGRPADATRSRSTPSTRHAGYEGLDVLGILDRARRMDSREWQRLLQSSLGRLIGAVGLAAYWLIVLILLLGGAVWTGLAFAETGIKDLPGLTISIPMLVGGVFLVVLAIFVRRKAAKVPAVASASQQPRVEQPAADPTLRDRPIEKRDSPDQFKIKVIRCLGASFVTIPGALILGRPQSLSNMECLVFGVIAALVAGTTSQLKWPTGKPTKLMKFRARSAKEAIIEGLVAGVIIPAALALFLLAALALRESINGGGH